MGTGVVSVGMFIAGVVNYFLQIKLSKMLSIEDFGIFNSLLSLTYIFSVPASALVLSIIKLVSNLKSKKSFGLLTKIYWGISLYTLMLSGVIFLVLVLAGRHITGYLNISSTALIYPYAAYVGLSYSNAAPRAYLQGLLRFKGFAFYSVLNALIRFILPVLFVYIGYKVYGVYLGLSLSVISAFAFGSLILKKNFQETTYKDPYGYYKKILKFSVPVLGVQIAMSIISNMDILIVKHFFDPESAGIYAGVVTIGKILLFGTGIVSTVMFPIIANAYAENKRFLGKFLAFFAVEVLAVLFGIALF